MRYVGIDLHKRDLVVAMENERGPVGKPRRFVCEDEMAIIEFFKKLRPFQAVIEASSSYRWLHKLLSSLGDIILAHPLRLRTLVTSRAKTDKLDAALLARLLRLGEIPTAYVPPQAFQDLRDLTRARSRLTTEATAAKNHLHALLGRMNLHPPFRTFARSMRVWISRQDLGVAGNIARDELLSRLDHYEREVGKLDGHLLEMAEHFPETEALTCVYGFGLYSALLIIGEFGEVERFRNDRQVGAYAGLTARVHQSGTHDYHGHITRQGSPWLRWILVQAGMKVMRRDRDLQNFYTRVRKRAGRNVARVAVARKLAGICWVRLRRWHREHAVPIDNGQALSGDWRGTR